MNPVSKKIAISIVDYVRKEGILSRKKVVSLGVLIVGILFLCPSCIEYEEDLTLNRDGSGILRQMLKMDNTFRENLRKSGKLLLTREEIEEALPPGSKLVEYQDDLLGKRTRVLTIGIQFDDFQKMFQLAEEGRAAFFGELIWRRDYLGRIYYQRVLKRKGVDIVGEGPYKDLIEMGVGKGMLTPYFLKFHLRSPYRVIRSNAATAKDYDLTWVVPLSLMLDAEKNIVLNAYLEKPLNLWLLVSIYGVVFLAVVLFIVYWVRKKRY